MKLTNDTEVVISGVGGYFPKAINIETFQQALFNNENALEPFWEEGGKGFPKVVGKLTDTELFDTSYFGVHHEQCRYMDPMQRLILERTFEALVDAGVNPMEIKGTKVGVYAGSTVGENDKLFYESIISGFGLTGHSRSMMPNRVSYWLNLKGPSCTYDANWLNGTVALQAAYDAIKEGHCESAIVGTANLVFNSELSWHYNDMGLLSPDGTTKAFDANANGYGRAEGVIVLYIQRACDAKRSYATILGVNNHFNGDREGSLLNLNADGMTDYINKFYNECNVDPKDVDYVECYGSGQSNIDELELTAIDRVYCKDRSKPLLVGAVKPNVGHAEASSALISLVKALIVLETGTIPATINYNSPNPNISALVEGRIEVVSKNRECNPELVAVNFLGLTSSYGHVLLKANPKTKKQQANDLPKLMALSTRTDEGIKDVLNSLKADGKNIDPEYAGLIQGTFKKVIPNHLYRGYVVLDGSEEQKSESEYHTGNKRQTWFVYSGMGSQWCKMACDLMALPIFAEAIHKCHKILEPKGIDLLKIVTEDDDKMFENILHSFVGIAAVQIGLTDVLNALGIVPDGIIGHSVGELGCAYADGCLSAEQMILCAYSRGRASLEADLIKGMMAAVGKGYQEMKDQCPPSIEIACHNGADSCTISGPTEDMEVFVKELQDKGLFARLVNVSNIAYHSKYIKPAAPLLLKYLKEIIPNPLPRSSKWISTSIPEEQWDSDLSKTSSADYHTNNLLSSVLFEEGSKHIPKESVVIEIAPHGLLQAILKRSLKANCTNVPLTHKSSKNQLNFLLAAIGKLYLAGLDVNIPALYPSVEYPVSRGTRSLTPLVQWEHGERWQTTEYGMKLHYLGSVREITVLLKNEEYRDLVGNQLKSTIIIPTSTYVGLVYDVLSVSKAPTKLLDVVFENLYFRNTISVPRFGNVSLHIMIHNGGGGFEISSGSELIGTGTIRIPELNQIPTTESTVEIETDCLQLNSSDVYSEFYHRGHKYGGVYKAIKNLKLTKEGCISTIQWNNNFSHLIEAMLQQYLFKKGERDQNTLTISRVQRIALSIPLLPTEPTEIEAVYKYATDTIHTAGLQIYGVGVKPLTLANRPISFDSVELTSLSNVNYKTIESGLNVCIHLVVDNFVRKDLKAPQDNSVMIVEVVTDNPVLENNIKNVVDNYTSLIANISTVRDSKKILISETEPILVIINDRATKDCINLLTSHAFLLAQTDKHILSYPDITQVAQFSLDGISYSLMRKSSIVKPVIVQIKADALSSKDLLRENLPWVSQLKSVVGSVEDRSSVYLVSNVIPFEGIRNFVQDISSLPNMNNIKLVFLLDKKAPEFTANEPAYLKIFKNSLKLTVIKKGCVSSFIHVPVPVKEGIKCTLQTTSNIVENIRLDYLGINVRDETLTLKGDHKPELGNIDYSGVTSSGQKIMGLARLNTEFCKLVPDPVLSWKCPKRWYLEDAATVPHAYSMAYYALVIVGRTRPHETVLVHGGASAFGLAAISVASNIGCNVYTTVTSEKQKAFMKKQFAFVLGDRNVFSACNTSFEPRLMAATGGQGAHVILNCLSGSLLSATLRCVAEFGKVIQVGKLDLEQNSEIGLRIFLKNVSLASVMIEDIFDAPGAVKQRLHDLVEQGMESLIVRPLRRTVVEHQNIESILRTLKQPEHVGKMLIKLSDNLELGQLNINNSSQFICDPKSSYLVYGGSSEMWIDVLHWLIVRGARKIVVSSESKAHQGYINRRLILFKNYFDVEIVFAVTKGHTRDNASELLSEVYRLGPIGAVFILPSKDSTSKYSDIAAVPFLDSALKTTAPKALFINFLNDAAGVCQLRIDAGFPTHNVQWEDTLEFPDVFYGLDDVLQLNVKDVYVKDDLLKDDIHETAQSFYKKLSLLLPSSIDQLKEETADASEKPDFIQLPSLAPRVIREVAPVFVVPSMFGRKAVECLASNLLCPVFCANYSNSPLSLQKTATDLAQRMKEIYPQGPYNIIAISYGGVLAIEVAKLLERAQASTHLLFIDAAPHSIQGIISHLGKESNSEVGFVCRLLDLTSPDIVRNLSNLTEWDSRLMYALQHYSCSTEDKYYLKKTLTVLKKYLDEILAYRPSEELIVGSISIVRPGGSDKADDCGLSDYFKESVDIFVVDGDHLSIVKDKATANFINNKVMC